jgi:uncharacterized LabA/DUF88 family protein
MAQTRIRIFIDFWNFQLAWNGYHSNLGATSRVVIPWEDLLPKVLASRAGDSGNYVGTHVYASIDPNSTKDRGLNRFLHAMDGFPGYSVIVKERRPASPVKCTNDACRAIISECPTCKQGLHRTVEKGIDTTLLTDLIKSAFDNTFDQAVLISEDSDFVPAVKFIQERWTKQIIHAYFRGRSDELRNACWKHVFLDDYMAELVPPSGRPAASAAAVRGG